MSETLTNARKGREKLYSASALARLAGIDHRTAQERLKFMEVEPAGQDGNGPLYRAPEALKAIFSEVAINRRWYGSCS